MLPEKYIESIKGRSALHYWRGYVIRFLQSLKYIRARRIARKRGAQLGEGVILSVSLARKLNANVSIGSHTSIQTDQLDTRNPLVIGSHVIIGAGTEVITTSHNIDSTLWEQKNYGLVIEDYVWLPTKVLVLPSCRKIGRGAVAGSGSVLVRDVPEMQIVSGNPATVLRERKCVHEDLVVESLLGGDFKAYREARKQK